MDLPCNQFLPNCDDLMAELFEDSGLDLTFDFRNDGTISPSKADSPPLLKRKVKRFSGERGTFSRQSADLAAISQIQKHFDLDSHVTGDGSSNCRLPTVFDSRHDLKCISPKTLAGAIKGTYDIGSYAIIDCRYPYEFQGGHIKNAQNIYKPDDIEQLLTTKDQSSPGVLIFHCEFSIERGPAMCRHLRQKDRAANIDNYPHLSYPEVYLLQGGYKSFYQEYEELCTPEGYRPMLDKTYTADLRHFRCKSKTWCAGQTTKPKKGLRLF